VFFVTNGVQIFGMQLHTNIFNYLTLPVYISYKPTRVCEKQWPRAVYLCIHGWPSPWDNPSVAYRPKRTPTRRWECHVRKACWKEDTSPVQVRPALLQFL
jgi:hypothetical protein